VRRVIYRIIYFIGFISPALTRFGWKREARFKSSLRAFTLLTYSLLLTPLFFQGTVFAGAETLRHNQEIVQALDREIASESTDENYLAILRGFRWCVIFNDKDSNFDFTFSNYLTMLDELSQQHSWPALTRIVHGLILREFDRAVPRLDELFTADIDGYGEFISILPTAYHHHVPVEPLRRFASEHFAGVIPPDRLREFRKAARERNYDLLTDLVVDATFIDMAYALGIEKDFNLPADHYKTVIEECSLIPFKARPDEEAYHDQNYYATHLLLALVHYGRRPLVPSVTGDKVFFYLASQYENVRNRVDDLDLLCEYLYCFRKLGPITAGFVAEGERYVVSMQRSDGSWGTSDDFHGDPYDQLHPTWTAITLLVQAERKTDKAND
jgi:hypothetical protein